MCKRHSLSYFSIFVNVPTFPFIVTNIDFKFESYSQFWASSQIYFWTIPQEVSSVILPSQGNGICLPSKQQELRQSRRETTCVLRQRWSPMDTGTVCLCWFPPYAHTDIKAGPAFMHEGEAEIMNSNGKKKKRKKDLSSPKSFLHLQTFSLSFDHNTN